MTWMMGQSAPSASLQMIQQRGVVDTPDDCAAVQRDLHWLAEWAGKAFTRNSIRLEYLSYRERLGELGLFSLEKRMRKGDLTNVYMCLMGGSKEDGATLFSVVPSDRTGGNGHTLKYRKFRSYIRKKCLTVRVTELWVVGSPLLELLKTQLTVVALSNLL